MAKKNSIQAKPATPVVETPINPDRFYRLNEVYRLRYFGCGKTALDGLIKAGKVTRPIQLSKRMCGWFGRQIIELQNDLAA